jgi:hypothetical protein
MDAPRPAPGLPATPHAEGGQGPTTEDNAALAAYQGEEHSLPSPGVDASGRAIPISDEEWTARFEDLKRRLSEIDAEDDTPEEACEQFMRELDEERRRAGRSPAFEGYY